MRLKVHASAQSIRERVEPLWNSQIHDLTALQKNYSESVLVALDTEKLSQITNRHPKPCQDASEVGIVILLLNGLNHSIIQGYRTTTL